MDTNSQFGIGGLEMGRIARLGWLCVCALCGVIAAAQVLSTLPAVVGSLEPDDGMRSFSVVLLWLPAFVILLVSATVIGTWLLGPGPDEATDTRRLRRRAVGNTIPELSEPDLAFAIPTSGSSPEEPHAAAPEQFR